ncbi:hypothetical protein D4764_16G0004560, partial [Takifugu flavidus]
MGYDNMESRPVLKPSPISGKSILIAASDWREQQGVYHLDRGPVLPREDGTSKVA